MLQQVY